VRIPSGTRIDHNIIRFCDGKDQLLLKVNRLGMGMPIPLHLLIPYIRNISHGPNPLNPNRRLLENNEVFTASS
jgi:hypothetical protein